MIKSVAGHLVCQCVRMFVTHENALMHDSIGCQYYLEELEDSTGLWTVLGLSPGMGSEATLAKDLPLPPAAIPRVFLVGAAPSGWENPPLFTFFGTVSNPPDITLLVLFPGDSALKTSAKTSS